MAERVSWRRRLDRWLLDPIEGVAAHLVLKLIRALTIDQASALGGWLLRTIGPWLAVSRRARRNLARTFPDKSPREIEAILRQVWDNLGRTAAEYPHLPNMRIFAKDGSPPDGRVEVVGTEHVDQAIARGKPILFFAAHLANWEIATLAALQYGVPLNVVYRAANNPHVERLFREGRGGIAAGLIPKGPEGARLTLKLLRQGRHLAMLLDQKMNDGIAVPFFGRPAMTAPALADLALKFDCTVLPTQIERLGGARFRLTLHPPLGLPRSGDRQADALAVMTRVNAMFEEWIRARPGQWLWLHNRWPD